MSPGSTDLFLHVGLPKTGTKYLQQTMQESTGTLAAHRFALVPRTRAQSTDLFRVARGDTAADESTTYTLDDYAAALGRTDQTRVLTSDERLASLSREQAEVLISAAGEGRPVHLVVTIRAFSRALPSAWQQDVKVGKTRDLETYATYLKDDWDNDRVAGFWAGRDLPDLLARWARTIPADRIHVCTVPVAQDSPTALLDRFGAALGLPAEDLRAPGEPVNTSLGLAQTEVLRRVNELLPEEMTRRTSFDQRTGWHVRLDWLGRHHLAAQPAAAVRMPSHWREWSEQIADAEIAFLAGAGVQVHGDLEDLRPRDTDFSHRSAAQDSEVLDVTVQVLADMVSERSAQQERRRSREQAREQATTQDSSTPEEKAPGPPADDSVPDAATAPDGESTGRRLVRSARSRLLGRSRGDG